MTEPRVNFLVAGVQKGGTTALFSYLNEHPELNMAPEKEVHFFDDETGVNWSAPDYDAFHRRFSWSKPGPAGEATPIYIYWPESLKRIRAYNPAMKLILLFRDPAERAYSQWRMETARGAETRPFSWCVRQGRERVRDNFDPPGHHRVFSYVERGFYGRQLEQCLRLFPSEQLLLLRSDDLRRDPSSVLGRVCDFLQVRHLPSPGQREVHVGAKEVGGDGLPPEDRAYLREVFAEDLDLFTKLSRLDTEAWR
jgi:hypothetical protein